MTILSNREQFLWNFSDCVSYKTKTKKKKSGLSWHTLKWTFHLDPTFMTQTPCRVLAARTGEEKKRLMKKKKQQLQDLDSFPTGAQNIDSRTRTLLIVLVLTLRETLSLCGGDRLDLHTSEVRAKSPH